MSQSQEHHHSSVQPMQAFRYVTKPPRTVQLSISELLTYVPPDWVEERHSSHFTMVEILCADILQSHIPRISVDQLKKLIPDALRIPSEIPATTKVLLPTTRVALVYQLVTEKNAISSEAQSRPLSEGQMSPTATPEKSPVAGSPAPQLATASSSRRFVRVLLWFQKKIGWRSTDPAKQKSTPDSLGNPPFPTAVDQGPSSEEESGESQVSSESDTKSALFASLPVLVPKPTPSSSESRAITTIEKTPAASATEHSKTQAPSSTTSDFPPFKSPDTTDQRTAVLDKKHLITPLSQPSEFLSNENKLQTLLLTEERLSIHRVLDLCSQLPGIRDCFLARGWQVVASSQRTSNLNPVKAGSQASALMDNIREMSAKMGVGTINAVTLYCSEGPVSVLGNQDLCFLVLHSDQERGFVPGVREKLQMILDELNKSRILIPAQVSVPKMESIAGHSDS